MDKLAIIIGGTVLVVGGVVLLSLFCMIPVWLVWNWLCPMLFGLPSLTLMQAWGLSFLCGMLFKSSSTSSSK